MSVNVDNNLKRTTPEIQALEALINGQVLPDLLAESGFPAGTRILVNCRLNQTGQSSPAPVWCAWVEKPASGQNPIGGTHLSPVYQEAYNAHGKVAQRKYPNDVAAEKKPDPNSGKPALSLDANSGLNWRRFICIKAGGKKAGTLTVGFGNDPQAPNVAKVVAALQAWAKGAPGKNNLVKFLEVNFNLGGAPHP